MAEKVAGEMYQDLTGQLFEIGRQLRQKNGYPFNPELLKTHLQLAIEGKFAIGNSEIFSATVDYSLSLEQMIAAGKYDWPNDSINAKNFPITGKGSVEVDFQIICFNLSISSEDALRKLDEQGLRPATLAELLAFGAKYPNEQRKFPIVALGSVSGIVGGREVACLYVNDSKRELDLYWFEYDWDDNYVRFLAVRK